MALYDGPNNTSPVLIRHCGQTKPDPDTFVSTGNQMYVRLKADGSVAGKGFRANYTWVRFCFENNICLPFIKSPINKLSITIDFVGYFRDVAQLSLLMALDN